MLFVSAFFAGSEIGIMSLNRYRLHYLVKKKHKNALRVNQLLKRPDRFLSVVLIGNTLGNIVASTAATLLGQQLYGDIGVAVATGILTLIIIIFSEMVPKTLAAMYTEELRSVVHEARLLLPVEHKSMLISLLDLERAKVEDIMVPKTEIIGIDLEQPWDLLVEELETSQHTRLPLYRNTIDNLVGMIHLRDVLNLVLDDEFSMDSLLGIVDAPYYIPEATPLNLQLLNFQKMKRRICFVVDEYGDLQGLVTMEDILEEVVGEFTTDVATLSREITPEEDGTIIVDGSITIRNLNRLMHWHLPLIGPRTLSGLIIEQLGYIPPNACCVRLDNYYVEVLKVSENTIKSLRIWKVLKKRV